jgi:hypothetical protein
MGIGGLGINIFPKYLGGLEMRDIYTMNKYLGGNIWWQWIKNTKALSVRIWIEKYIYTEENFILLDDYRGGSLILFDYSSWDVRDRASALY